MDIFVFGGGNLESLFMVKEKERGKEKKEEAGIFVSDCGVEEGMVVEKKMGESTGIFIFGCEDNEDVGSEILFNSGTVVQVGEAPIPTEPEKINFCTECMGNFRWR